MNITSVGMITDDVDRLVEFYENVTFDLIPAVRYTLLRLKDVTQPSLAICWGDRETVLCS